MDAEILAPNAHLFESMRAVGYSLATAIADVIDNSLAAASSAVEIGFDGGAQEPYLFILDNGRGMNGEQARKAMQLAGTSAVAERSSLDLGRFGLGLKTASLSQCRRLTLVTKDDQGEVVALRWDLDYLAKTGQWSLLVLEAADLVGLPAMETFEKMEKGTLVVWQVLDRLTAQSATLGTYLDAQMVEVEAHLALVFHRFLNGDGVARAAISVNGNQSVGVDPFLTKSTRTQPSHVETIDIGGEAIVVQAFTLPLIGTMSPSERRRATANGDLRDSQGFYVYRGGRLVIWGTWFRLIPRAEMSKLTRVRVDIPNSLDHLWSLDIKKSSAAPPAAVRERLKTLAATLVEPSERVHRYRGRSVADDGISHGWSLVEGRESVRYEVNRDHPSIRALADVMDPTMLRQLEDALGMLESTLPVQDIHNRMSTDAAISNASVDAAEAERWVDSLLAVWNVSAASQEPGAFLDRMLAAEPFNVLVDRRTEIFSRMINDTEAWKL